MPVWKKNPLTFVMICISLIGAGSAVNCAMPDRDDHNVPMNTHAGYNIEKGQSMRVLWTVSGYKRGPNALSQKEDADAMIFKPLDMDDSSITFDGNTCKNVAFKRERQQLETYLMSRFAITPQLLDMVNEEVEVVKTSCSLPGFSEYLRLSDRRLVIVINGIFFFLEPVLY